MTVREINLQTGEEIEREYTPEELVAIQNAPKPLIKDLAQAELDAITGHRGTIIRCVIAGTPVPAEWRAHVNKLRAIVSGSDTTSTTLPDRPAFPPGT